MWSAEDKSLAEGHKREGWTSVSLSIGPKESNKRKAEKDKQDAPKKTLKKDVFGSIEDDSVDQERFQAQATRLVSEGVEAAAAGDNRKAFAKFEQALFFDPLNAKCHEMKAQTLNTGGDTWGAVQAATAATKLRPEWADAWVTLAQCQGNLGEPELALASAAKAREAGSDAGTLASECAEWEKLAEARKADKSTDRTRVNIVDPDKPGS